MNRQQKHAFRELVAALIRRLDRSAKLGERQFGNYVVRKAARAAGE